MDTLELITNILVWLIPILYAITLHEVAHGWAARQCGDDTASRLGRLSLNPLRHLDPVGTVVVPIVLLIFSGYVFGWARPVPVNFSRLHKPRLDVALVALAGPMANLLMLMTWILVSRIASNLGYSELTILLMTMASKGIYINLVLMLLNLMPIPPLDGGRIVMSLFPGKLIVPYMRRIELAGIAVLLAVLMGGGLDIFQQEIYEMQIFLHELAGM